MAFQAFYNNFSHYESKSLYELVKDYETDPNTAYNNLIDLMEQMFDDVLGVPVCEYRTTFLATMREYMETFKDELNAMCERIIDDYEENKEKQEEQDPQ